MPGSGRLRGLRLLREALDDRLHSADDVGLPCVQGAVDNSPGSIGHCLVAVDRQHHKYDLDRVIGDRQICSVLCSGRASMRGHWAETGGLNHPVC